MIPGSSKSGIHKRWSAKFYSDLSKIFFEQKFDVIATGGDTDKDIVNEIISYNRKIIQSEYLSNFNNFISLCNGSSLIISVDTGPTQIAALSEKPIIWLVNRSPYNITNVPISKNIHIINADKMQNISVDEVAKVSKNILNIR